MKLIWKCSGLRYFFFFFFFLYIRNWDLKNCENIVITISVTTFSQNIYFHLWLVTVSYFIILFRPIRNWHLNNCEICYVNITIYMQVYINFFFKKHKPMNEKKMRWTIRIEQTKKYCSFYTFTQQVPQHFHKTFIFSCRWL